MRPAGGADAAMKPRFGSLTDAVELIGDGATVASDGFTMMGVAEGLLRAIGTSFAVSGHPRDLVFVHAAGQSNRSEGIEHLAVDGLVRRVVGSHWGLAPRMATFLAEDRAEAVCLPQGQLAQLYRAIAGGRPGNLTQIGLGTFVDPRLEGGKVNGSAREHAPDYVRLLELDGQEQLLYHAFPVDVAIIRASAVDEFGNCSQEEEAVALDALAVAQAARNSGGIVICQAKRVVPAGSIPPRQVTVPGCLVDYVVPVSDVDRDHRQTDGAVFDTRYVSTSASRAQGAGHPNGTAEDGRDLSAVDVARRAIGRRAIRYLSEGEVINLGTGIPGDTVGPALLEAGIADRVAVTIESGVHGGLPLGGTDFGIAAWPSAILPHAAQFDFYRGGLDTTFMGAGQVDPSGNVNVSHLGGRIIGCGGFIDITQSARRVIFCFTLGGRHPKLVRHVDQLTFSGDEARRRGQEVIYVTDRGVFELDEGGLCLVEVAPGVDVQRDVLDVAPFPVRVREPFALMPHDTFAATVAPFSLATIAREKAGTQ